MIGEYKVVVDTVVVDVDVEDVVVVGIVEGLCLHPFRNWTRNMFHLLYISVKQITRMDPKNNICFIEGSFQFFVTLRILRVFFFLRLALFSNFI